MAWFTNHKFIAPPRTTWTQNSVSFCQSLCMLPSSYTKTTPYWHTLELFLTKVVFDFH